MIETADSVMGMVDDLSDAAEQDGNMQCDDVEQLFTNIPCA